ncbi:hypothetical protein [Streptomyces canus]|uniref:hypothetical protein n=1 Tax=Streptomyces canus TaxID=58343 RepID=UPI00324E4B83
MVQSGKTERVMALTTLRERLEDGLASSGMTKTQLAARADLGRTTVQTAFQLNGPVPSAGTVAALAQALRLPKSELLELRRSALDGNGSAVEAEGADDVVAAPGRLISQWNPHDLEVHPAGPALVRSGSKDEAERLLPGYVSRPHDLVLTEAVELARNGSSELVMLVGSSSTGKTRACWEAVQPLACEGWRVWHPFDPTRAEAALAELTRVGTQTVIWFNEAQHYLGDPQHGEHIAAAVHQLLTDPSRVPVLVLGTLWPEYARQLTAQPAPGAPDAADPHSRARELLAGRTVNVPEAFDREALGKAATLAENGDLLLADALTRTSEDGRITQDLAGAPELLRRHQQGSPAAQAVLNAAMDARRLGVGLHLPQTFLTAAATDYLTDFDYDQLTEDWAERAFAELAEPVHGKQAPLRRTGLRPQRRPPGKPESTGGAGTAAAHSGPMFRLSDYLEQHGRASRHLLCPPASFWHAAHAHLMRPADLDKLAIAAQDRHRLQWSHHLRRRAAAAGSGSALLHFAELAKAAGDTERAEVLYQQAASAGDTVAKLRLAALKSEHRYRDEVLPLYQQAADSDDSDNFEALAVLAEAERVRVDEEAEVLYREAADEGNTHALIELARARNRRGDTKGVEALYKQAADGGNTEALVELLELRAEKGDKEELESLRQAVSSIDDTDVLLRLAGVYEKYSKTRSAEFLYLQVANAGDTDVLLAVAMVRERQGDAEGAEALYQQAIGNGNTNALILAARMVDRRGDRESAKTLYRQSAENGDTDAVVQLVGLCERMGHGEEAEFWARSAADADDTEGLILLGQLRERNGDEASAEIFYQEAADAGDTAAMAQLALLREKRGLVEEAEGLVQRAANLGHTGALMQLAHLREGLGNLSGAEDLYRQAADCGRPVYRVSLNRWPWGLDPDGTPTPRWENEGEQGTSSTE